MLPKQQRLRSSDFKTLTGFRVFQSPHFLIRVKAASSFRAAAVVSAAVAKKAVSRNLLRRRVYAALEKKAMPPALLVITAKKGAAELSFAEIELELVELLKKYRILNIESQKIPNSEPEKSRW